MKRFGFKGVMLSTCLLITASLLAGCLPLLGVLSDGGGGEAEFYAAEGPFAVGELLPRESRGEPRRVAYGDFPFIASAPELKRLASAFAGMQINPDGMLSSMKQWDFLYYEGATYEAAVTMFEEGHEHYMIGYDCVSDSAGKNIYFEQIPAHVLLATNFSEDERARVERETGALEVYEFARLKDALVFVTWNDNPLDSLTADQLRGLMSGEIDDWSQVGGQAQGVLRFDNIKDAEEPLFRMRLMGDTPMGYVEMEPHEIPSGVEGGDSYTIDQPATFRNESGAIGITTYNKAQEKGYKMLAIDGVAPNEETLVAAAYPIVSGCYAVYRAEDEEHAAGRFVRWLKSDEGKDTVRELGWVPTQD